MEYPHHEVVVDQNDGGLVGTDCDAHGEPILLRCIAQITSTEWGILSLFFIQPFISLHELRFLSFTFGGNGFVS
jgi:hypothetical protein